MERGLGTSGAMGENDSGMSSCGLFFQHPGEWNGVAAICSAGCGSERAIGFWNDAGGEDVSCRIELRAIDAALGMVGGAGNTAPGYWTGTGVDRFVSGKQSNLERGKLPRTWKREIDAAGVNFPHKFVG